MSQSLIILSTHALKVKPDVDPSPPSAAPLPDLPNTAPVLSPSTAALTTIPSRPSSIPTHVGDIPLEYFKQSVKRDVGNHKFFIDPDLENTKYISKFPTG